MLSRIALTASRVSESRSSALNRSAAAGKTPLPTACANMTRQERDPARVREQCDRAGDEAVGEEALDDEHELAAEQRRDEDGGGRREQARAP